METSDDALLLAASLEANEADVVALHGGHEDVETLLPTAEDEALGGRVVPAKRRRET